MTEVHLGATRDFEAGNRRTADAMRAGADYIYQAVFFSNGWRGIADFLEPQQEWHSRHQGGAERAEIYREVAPRLPAEWGVREIARIHGECRHGLRGAFDVRIPRQVAARRARNGQRLGRRIGSAGDRRGAAAE